MASNTSRDAEKSLALPVEDEEPISEGSVAGLARGVGFGLPTRTPWQKNLPELLIGAVIVSAGVALAWLSWAPRDAAPPARAALSTARTQSAAQVPAPASKRPERRPKENVATKSEAALVVAVPWVDGSPSESAACRPMTMRNMNRSVQQRARSEKRGHDMLLRGSLHAALEAFCDATRYDAPSPLALTGLVHVQLALDDPESALGTVERLVEFEPQNSEAHNLLGDVLIRLGRVDDAKAAWTSATGATHLSSWLEDRLRKVSLAEAKTARAAAAYPLAERMLRRAVALGPEDVDSVVELASVLSKAGNDEAAEQWLTYAQGLDAKHPAVQELRREFGVIEQEQPNAADY